MRNVHRICGVVMLAGVVGAGAFMAKASVSWGKTYWTYHNSGYRTDMDGTGGVQTLLSVGENAGVRRIAVVARSQTTTLFVDDDAPLGGDGASWNTAYTYLQDALADASLSGVATEIRIAQGIYKPDQDEAGTVTSGERSETFHLLDNVEIKGGYAGLGAPDPDLRDVDNNATILTGDLAGNDGPDFANYGENAYHVTTASGVNSTAVLDGVTITGGNADGPDVENHHRGGGMFNDGGSPTVNKCTFLNNQATRNAGMLNWSGCNPTLTNCVFTNNQATTGGGGGMYVATGSATVTLCTFSGNSASTCGGGLSVVGADVMLTECVFSGNDCGTGGGGALFVGGSATANMTNCALVGNHSSNYGGGIWVYTGSTLTATNCSLSGNTADPVAGGGAISNFDSTVSTTNCIFWDNADGSGTGQNSQIRNDGTYTLDINYSCVTGWNGAWGGTGNIGDDPSFVDAPGGNLRLSGASPCIDAGSNDAVPAGVTTDLDGKPRFVDDTYTPDSGSGTPPIVDMGAYEYQAPPLDCNSNGIDDREDIASGTSMDCNFNLVPDECDLDDGTSEDCNVNGFADECETATDHNCCETAHGAGCSHPDIEACVCAIDTYCCDVDWDRLCVELMESDNCWWCGFPAADDCNDNEVPDECEPDFDGDGLIDDCDSDIDEDGVPNEEDACDFTPWQAIAAGRVILDPGSCLYGTLRCDYDGDCDCDLADYAEFQQDFTGPNP